MADDLFQILDGITVDEEDIREAEIFSVGYLQPLFPDLDLREGTALRDTSIRAAATLFALARKGLTYYFTINSLDNATDQTPEETIDSLLSNFFLQRKIGSNSVITARMYFAISKDVSISTSLFFSPDNELFYFPKEAVGVSADNLLFDASTQQYYTDIDLESETSGEDYNIETGQLLYFSNFDPFFLGADILFLKERSISQETNTEFIARAGSAVSTRNLINSPSIDSRIQEVFNTYTNITSVGYGEEEMLRDLVKIYTGNPPEFADIHQGGQVDVYVSSEVDTIVEQFTVDASISGVRLEGEFAGVFDIERVEGGTDEVPFDTELVRYRIELQDYTPQGEPIEPRFDLGLSSRQSLIIRLLNPDGTINNNWGGSLISFTMKRASGLPSLQAYLDDTLSRVVCADLLARSYEIFELDVDINTHTVTDKTVDDADTYVRQYVNSLLAGDRFVVSELMEILSRDADIQDIVTPVTIDYTLHTKNLFQGTGTITSIHTPTRLQRYIVNSVTLNGDTL